MYIDDTNVVEQLGTGVNIKRCLVRTASAVVIALGIPASRTTSDANPAAAEKYAWVYNQDLQSRHYSSSDSTTLFVFAFF
jgi:hypothetical protein